jgi:hypothetical protein
MKIIDTINAGELSLNEIIAMRMTHIAKSMGAINCVQSPMIPSDAEVIVVNLKFSYNYETIAEPTIYCWVEVAKREVHYTVKTLN